jgi:replicative DNA helicase
LGGAREFGRHLRQRLGEASAAGATVAGPVTAYDYSYEDQASSASGAGALAPPHSLEAEQSVLGAVLLSDKVHYAYVIEEGLKPDDFYRERHQVIYESMLDLYSESEPIDVVTVTEHLRARGALEQAGGPAEIDALTAAVPAVGNLRRYGQIVREMSLLRKLLTATYEIQASVHNHEGLPRDIVEQAEKAMLEVGRDDRQKDFRRVGEVLHEELDRWHELSTEGRSMTGTASGFADLDAMTGGFQPGNMIILAARPSMGKCLTGSALVYDPLRGGRRRLDEVVRDVEMGSESFVASLGPDFKLRTSRVTASMRSGVKPVFRLTTNLGRQVEATANHPLLTIRGWRRLDELQAGDRIAVPRTLPRGGMQQTMPDCELVLLAGLIADGNLTQRTPRFAFGPDSPVIDTMAAAGNPVTAGYPANHVWRVGSRGRSRPRMEQLAQVLDAPPPQALAESDVWWDEVVAIEPIGEQETYDIEVLGDHNFVANDIVVHNSALVTNFAENVALNPERPRPVALFSLEMSESELAQRFVASQASIKGDDLRKGRLKDPRKWQRVLETAARYDRSPLFVDDSSDIGMLEMRAKARRLHQQTMAEYGGLGLIIIDYLQLLRTDARTDNRVQAIGEISRGIKILARELAVPVIALSQLSRGVESRTDKKPMLSDLRESGQIEQDADLVMFIYRDEYYNENTDRPGEADLIVAKHRNGGLGEIPMTFQGEYPRFLGLQRAG